MLFLFGLIKKKIVHLHLIWFNTGVAQLVEQRSPKPQVVSSSLAARACCIMEYIKNSFQELVQFVTFPTWKDLLSVSYNVLLLSFVVAILLFVIDFVTGIQSVQIFGFDWKGLLGFIYAMI